MHNTNNTIANATFTSSISTITIAPTTTSIVTICKIKSIKMKISVYEYNGYQKSKSTAL